MNTYFKNKPHQLVLITLLVILPISSSLCIDMYLPAYPEIAKNFAITEGMVNISMSTYLIGLALGQLIYGPFADRYGRKKLLIIGLLLFSFASLACFVTLNFKIFLLTRFIQAIGACSCIILCRAIVADIFHPEKRTKILALISASNIFSPALAPLLGGYIATWYSWRGIFLVITIFGIIMLVSISFVLKETLISFDMDALHIKKILANFVRLIKNLTFLSYIACIGCLAAMAFTWVTYAPEVLVTTFGISENDFGLFFLIPAIGSTAGALFTAKFTALLGERKLIITGLSLIIIGTISLWLQTNIWPATNPVMILISIMLAFFGMGISVPQFISGAIAPFIDIAGFTSGIIGFVQTSTGSLSGLITSSHYNAGYKTMGVLMFVLSALAVLSFLFNLLRPEKSLALVTKSLSLVRYVPLFHKKKENNSPRSENTPG